MHNSKSFSSSVSDGISLKRRKALSKLFIKEISHDFKDLLSISEADPESSVIWLRTLSNKLVINYCWKSIHWNNGLKVLLNDLSWRINMSEDKII